MFLCLDCDNLFEEPKYYTECHGLFPPAYETWLGCPKCGGAYVETFECGECGNYITGEYVQLKDGICFCERCYEVKDISDRW